MPDVISTLMVALNQAYLAQARDLPEIKCLDDLAFQGHQGITTEELETILQNGAIVFLRDDNGVMIGESQVLLSPAINLPYTMEPSEAYYYGTAIHPDHQGNGFGQVLAEAQDQIARENGKTTAVLTLEVENYPSLKLRTSRGFHIVGYFPSYYGPAENGGARLLLKKALDTESQAEPKRIAVVSLSFSRDPADRDLKVHRQIVQLLAEGYRGISVTPSSIVFGQF